MKLLWLIILFLLSCGEFTEEITHPNRADLGGLDPWMKELMIEAAGYWGDTLKHSGGSSNQIKLKQLPNGIIAQYKYSPPNFVIRFDSDTSWGDCRDSLHWWKMDFLTTAEHEWGHHRKKKDNNNSGDVMFKSGRFCYET